MLDFFNNWFCIVGAGFSNPWVITTSFIAFTSFLIVQSVSLITKATDKNKKPNLKKVIILTTASSFLFTFFFFTLATRSLFIYEISDEDYVLVKKYVSNPTKKIVISRIGTKILLCDRKEISLDMKKGLIFVSKQGYITYEDLICFANKSCEK